MNIGYGKEFFGSDPTIATKNLPADAVEKVQVFDKKSEMAEFTGVDDGQEEKTINLSLKEDKKNGHFGNLKAGYGSDNRFQGKGNINRFGGGMQLSAIGMANNINEQGFTPNEYINFMGGLRSLMSGGMFRLSLDGSSGLPITTGLSDGFVDTYAGGLNFNYDFGKKTKLRSSYFYNQIENETNRSISRENFLEDTNFFSSELSDQKAVNKNHRLNARLEHKIDTSQELSLRTSLGWNKATLNSQNQSQLFNTANALETTGNQAFATARENFDFDANALYKRRFRKPGRSLIFDVNLSTALTEGNGDVSAINTFLIDQVNNTFSENLDQEQIEQNDGLDYGGKVAYSEPIGKGKYLEISYSRQNFNNEVDKQFYDLIGSERMINSTLSNKYNRDYLYDRPGLMFKKVGKKTNTTIGVNAQWSTLKGTSSADNLPIKKDYQTILPFLRWEHDFTGTRSLTFNYRTRFREPSLEQLQPQVDNSDPLNIYIGNPDLRPEYRHTANLEFMSFDQFSNINMFGRIEGTYIANSITNSRTIDDDFRQTFTPVNIANAYQMEGYLNFGAPLRFIKSTFNVSANLRYNRGILLVNGQENNTDQWNNNYQFSIENRKKEILDIVLGADLYQNSIKYNQLESLDQSWLNQVYFMDATLNIKDRWTIESNVDYTIYSNESFGGTQEVVLWRAGIGAYLLKKKAQLKLSVFDLLNQNVGINRSNNLNYTQEERVQSLGRFFMLTFSYSIAGFGKQSGFEVTTSRR